MKILDRRRLIEEMGRHGYFKNGWVGGGQFFFTISKDDEENVKGKIFFPSPHTPPPAPILSLLLSFPHKSLRSVVVDFFIPLGFGLLLVI